MRTQKRIDRDVCEDPDMSGIVAWRKYAKKHPDLREKARKIIYALPYSLQDRANDMSPQFSVDCRVRRDAKMSILQIAEDLGVSCNRVSRVLGVGPGRYRHLSGKIGPHRWRTEDFDLLLDRMRTERRTLEDVCRDSDIPSRNSWSYFLEKHPEYADKARKIIHSLSYSSQHKGRKVSPRFSIDCGRLHAKGMTLNDISFSLGVSVNPIMAALKHYYKTHKKPSPPPMGFPPSRYEAIIQRIRNQQRLIRDVCKDPDLPCFEAWHNFTKKHPEFLEKYRQAIYSLPYHLQLKTMTLSPELLDRCQRMWARGMTQKEIAARLGISLNGVRRLYRVIRRERGEEGK